MHHISGLVHLADYTVCFLLRETNFEYGMQRTVGRDVRTTTIKCEATMGTLKPPIIKIRTHSYTRFSANEFSLKPASTRDGDGERRPGGESRLRLSLLFALGFDTALSEDKDGTGGATRGAEFLFFKRSVIAGPDFILFWSKGLGGVGGGDRGRADSDDDDASESEDSIGMRGKVFSELSLFGADECVDGSAGGVKESGGSAMTSRASTKD